MSELDPRKRIILQAVILEYVHAAEPVGSELITQKYDLGVKSATVRNELAEITDLGYLEQPHTSAGRVPSDQGYRYYVDHLIPETEVDESAKARLRGATNDGDALQTMLRDTTRTLSRVTHLLSVGTTVRDRDVTVRAAAVSALGPSQILLVLVLSNGHVENRMLECPAGLTLQDVGHTNELLGLNLPGRTLRSLQRTKAPTVTAPGVERLITKLWPAIRGICRELTRGVMIMEGEEFIFGQPEFKNDVGSLSALLDHLAESDLLYEAIHPGDEAKVVTIGRENRREEMRQFSIVRHSFRVGDHEAGTIAVIGPTRMRYEQSIPLIHFTARALSDSLSKYLAS